MPRRKGFWRHFIPQTAEGPVVEEGEAGGGLRASAIICAENMRTCPGVESPWVWQSEPGKLLSVLQNPKLNVHSLPSLSLTDSSHLILGRVFR